MSFVASHVSPILGEASSIKPENSLRDLCSPYELSMFELEHLNQLAGTRRKIPQYRTLYQAGDCFEAIYAIRSGFFKTEIFGKNGRSQITGFQMVGEMLGIDGLGAGHHLCDAIALENSEVYVLPFAKLEMLIHDGIALQRNLHKVLGREIAREHKHMFLLDVVRAEERLATFLLDLSQRFAERGYSSREFDLRMLREEIGSYLGLKTETVSRAFSKLQEAGCIGFHQKHIRILNMEQLKTISQQCACG